MHNIRTKQKHNRVVGWVTTILEANNEPMSLHEIIEALRHYKVRDYAAGSNAMKALKMRNLPTLHSLSSIMIKCGHFKPSGYGMYTGMNKTYQVRLWAMK